ncbi:MAG: hypothetical protein Q8O42_22945 [Acidobacteriota bacterium]|nr:hypothetical protein [Acidobacteriota bacterium]
MKNGTTSAAVLGLVGGIALGVWVGAEMTSGRTVAEAPTAVEQTLAAPAPEPVTATPRRARVVRAAPATVAPAKASEPKLVMTIPVSAPELHDRMKPVLARGTKIPMAVEGFKDAEQFATIAHAARNTQVPFILLKHRVLVEGQSLEAAIRASKPELDASAEVKRARTEARGDIAALSATD